MSATLGQEIGEHLDGIKRSTRTLGVELHPPNFLARLCGRLNTFDGGVVAVDEERFPTRREGILKLQGVLVVLTTEKGEAK